MHQDPKKYWAQKTITREEVNVFAKKSAKYLSQGMSVLDLGCGYGTDTIYLAKKGLKVTAIDFSEASVSRLREKVSDKGVHSITILQHDLSKKLPFPDRTFDAVYAHLSIHYFDDATTRRVIAENMRVLKPNGFFFVKCKSVDDALYGKGKKVGEDMYEHDHVRHFFRKEYMQSLVADFEILSLRRTSSKYVDYRSAFIEAIVRKSKR